MPSDSRQVKPKNVSDAISYPSSLYSPTAMMLDANCHVEALKASEIQYAINEVTPHFRSARGTGSRSLLVLFFVSHEMSSSRKTQVLTIADVPLQKYFSAAPPSN